MTGGRDLGHLPLELQEAGRPSRGDGRRTAFSAELEPGDGLWPVGPISMGSCKDPHFL